MRDRDARYKVEAQILAIMYDIIADIGWGGNHQWSPIDISVIITIYLVTVIILIAITFLFFLTYLPVVVVLINLQDLLTGLVTIHNRHVQVHDNSVEVLWFFVLCFLVLGILVVVEFEHIFLDLTDCQISIYRRDYLYILEALKYLDYNKKLEGLVINHKNF